MTTERWQQIETLFAEALAQPAGGREPFIARRCGADASMRDDVASLVRAAAAAPDFLATPALDVFARQIAHDGWSVRRGDRIGVYQVAQRLGAGGMGEVWRARDERLGRDVAIKLLLPHATDAAARLHAFEREARAAGALNHPNVLTVHDVGTHAGAPYLISECLEGESLRARLARGALPTDEALDIAVQVARGLGAAHARGIVHRDLKPENIFLVREGPVKILDFGLATLRAVSPGDAPLPGGTAGYMAPEQARGEPVDARADIFALGAVLYEMLAGTRWAANHDVPIGRALSPIVSRCLAASASERFATVDALRGPLEAVRDARSAASAASLRAILRRPAAIVSIVLAVAAVGAGAWWMRTAAARARWAHVTAAPEIRRLANHGLYGDAFVLLHDALEAVPDDPQLRQLRLDVTGLVSVTTDPAGAEVAFATYRTTEATRWFELGRTPIADARIPRGISRFRVSKPGFATIEGTGSPGRAHFRLDPANAIPAGMIRVPRGRDALRFGSIGPVTDYWMDRFEISNRQYKEFVDRGGYRDASHWRERFVDRGRPVTWHAAVARFVDTTGQPGPATWARGTYPEGQADLPVGGVSWYEAAAYAHFAGKSLPTIYHWYRAAALGRFADILTVSNFSGTGPAAVGTYQGLGPFGTYDMAGNVKEWCWNETDGKRFLLGGAWDEPPHMFADYDARGPFERTPGYGIRLAKYDEPLPGALTAAVHVDGLDGRVPRRAPVRDEIFEVYRRQYAYDRTPLNAAIEATEETDAGRKVTVTFDAAYGGERMRALLFLPQNVSPPFQAVVFFPAADAFRLPSSRDITLRSAEFILRSGRAFLYPVYAGTYERSRPEGGANAERDLHIAWSRDLGRTLDYLETRADIDSARVGFYGVSAGADAGVVLTALEPRLKASVLQGTGLVPDAAPETDAKNFAPHVRVPTLLLNGRYDFETPFETAQRPLFDLLGPPTEDKHHTALETGHALPAASTEPLILAWFDRYLGRVRR